MNSTKDISPVYLTIPKLEHLLDFISKRSLNEIGLKIFTTHGYNQSDASLAVNALKFLRVADETGRVDAETCRKFQLKGPEGKKEIEKVIRDAYSKLFDSISEPQSLEINELMNDFSQIYNLSPRLAKPATLAFLKLCEYGGLKEEGSIVGRKRTMNGRSKTTKEKDANSSSNSSRNRTETSKNYVFIEVANGEVALKIPNRIQNQAWNNEILNEDLRSLIKAINLFAEKHIISESADSVTQRI